MSWKKSYRLRQKNLIYFEGGGMIEDILGGKKFC